MSTETGASIHASILVALAAVESLPMVWQVMAVLAVAGLVLVVILAIIEPGPLVKKRPFPRKQRSRGQESIDLLETDREPDPVPAGADENFDQKEGGRRHADGHSGGA